jgi:hypothetical protein
VTDREGIATSAADPAPQESRPQRDAPPKRSWWKSPVRAAGAAIILAVIGVGGYLGFDAVLPHPSSQTTSASTESVPDQVPNLPRGASSCPPIQTDVQGQFDLGARGTPATSCPFVEQVRKAYAGQNSPTSAPRELIVFSPATSKPYKLACLSSTTYVTCTGAAAAVIYLYNKPGSR